MANCFNRNRNYHYEPTEEELFIAEEENQLYLHQRQVESLEDRYNDLVFEGYETMSPEEFEEALDDIILESAQLENSWDTREVYAW